MTSTKWLSHEIIMTNGDKEPHKHNPIVLYTAPDGKVTVDVYFAKDNFWLTQKTMAELFAVKIPAISKHLKNIYNSGELMPEATISKMETVQTEGGRKISRAVEFYNLDAVIAVGYRVNSAKATHFRIWATRFTESLEGNLRSPAGTSGRVERIKKILAAL